VRVLVVEDEIKLAKAIREAQDISAGDLHGRLPEPAAKDEVRRLAETLNAMLERLQGSFDRERTFVSDASHELRTPLARLRAEMELAFENGESVAELREAIASGVAEVDVLTRLADDLLVLARADQGRLPVRREPIRLAAFLEDVGAWADRSALIEVDCPPAITVEADPLRLRQAVGNLLDNAQRHGSPAVRVVAVVGATSVRIHVIDDGPGVPASLHDTAFDRFSRGDAAREGSGAGLGLSIVAAIAGAHGGSAGIAEAPGGGADIWIDLPLHSVTDPVSA
jgi:signal transduction histidine kinase